MKHRISRAKVKDFFEKKFGRRPAKILHVPHRMGYIGRFKNGNSLFLGYIDLQ